MKSPTNCFLGILTLSFFFLSILGATAQGKLFIRGQLVDSQTGKKLGFATVKAFDSRTNGFANGNISSEDGKFKIEVSEGKFYITVDYIGFESYKSNDFILSSTSSPYDVGIIKMKSSSETLDEVIVQGEKSTMELSLDKKTFNVGSDLGSAGGTATDILNNIPSVTVDGEGNVKLRGSENVRILIDGKPSGLISIKGGSGLQQLQGSLIEKVEIITNPSARYEAEGMSGVINIVLKKEKKEGINGSFEIITGYPANFGGGANINFRHKKVNFFINYGIAYRIQPGEGTLYQETYKNDTTAILKQTTEAKITGFNNNIRGGLDYYFDERNSITASYLFRRSDAKRITKFRYEDYINGLDNLLSITYRKQDEVEDEPNSEYALSYKRTFSKEGHELTADFRFLDNWERSDQLFTQNGESAEGIVIPSKSSIQKSLNDEYEKQYLFQVDYIQPIREKGKLEAGLRTSLRDMVNDYFVNEVEESGDERPLPGLDNYFIYNEDIYAVYGIYGNKLNKFSYQFGIRGELTNVKTTLRDTKEENPRRYSNLFPSVHITYDLPRKNAIQVSYSRRVRRPKYNDLSPFMTFSDNRNFFSGNPNLNPEFSDAFEMGHIKYLEQGSFTTSLYYRYTKGKIESIRRVDDEGNSTTKPENLNTQNAFGAEFTGSYSIFRWWKQDLNVNFFRAITDGKNINEKYSSNTYSWFSRSTSKFSLVNNIDLQIRANYEAPQKTAQGSRKSLYYIDLAASKDIFSGKGTITFNVLDVFNSRRTRSITEGINFFSEGNSLFRKRQINLTLSYRLNQSKPVEKPKKKLEGEE